MPSVIKWRKLHTLYNYFVRIAQVHFSYHPLEAVECFAEGSGIGY